MSADTNPLASYFYKAVPGTDDFQAVTSFDDGGGYDWTTWAVWYSPSRRRYFVASGSGCSCNSLSDGYDDVADFEALTSKEAVKESLRQFINGNYEYRALRDRPSIDDEIAGISSFRPAVSA